MGQRKTSKGLDSLSRATDILSTLLAQQVRELNARQRENRRSGAEDPGTMKGLKGAASLRRYCCELSRLSDLDTLIDAVFEQQRRAAQDPDDTREVPFP